MFKGSTSIVLVAAIAAVTCTACFFVDDERGPHVRGYTDCGDFLGGETCSPGQYCADPGFSDCALGCLSDVNCASNQVCSKSGAQQVGVCENVRSSSTLGLSYEGGDAGGDTVSADAFGADVLGGDAN